MAILEIRVTYNVRFADPVSLPEFRPDRFLVLMEEAGFELERTASVSKLALLRIEGRPTLPFAWDHSRYGSRSSIAVDGSWSVWLWGDVCASVFAEALGTFKVVDWLGWAENFTGPPRYYDSRCVLKVAGAFGGLQHTVIYKEKGVTLPLLFTSIELQYKVDLHVLIADELYSVHAIPLRSSTAPKNNRVIKLVPATCAPNAPK